MEPQHHLVRRRAAGNGVRRRLRRRGGRQELRGTNRVLHRQVCERVRRGQRSRRFTAGNQHLELVGGRALDRR